MPKLSLSHAEYEKLDKVVGLKDDEFYTVVTHFLRGRYRRSIHVFHRPPTTKELVNYENTVSKLRIRHNRTDVEGSQTLAARDLYNALIDRAYDVPLGNKILGEIEIGEDGVSVKSGSPLTRDQAQELVPPLIKRTAIMDAIGEHYSESRVAEMDGVEEEVKKDEED